MAWASPADALGRISPTRVTPQGRRGRCRSRWGCPQTRRGRRREWSTAPRRAARGRRGRSGECRCARRLPDPAPPSRAGRPFPEFGTRRRRSTAGPGNRHCTVWTVAVAIAMEEDQRGPATDACLSPRTALLHRLNAEGRSWAQPGAKPECTPTAA